MVHVEEAHDVDEDEELEADEDAAARSMRRRCRLAASERFGFVRQALFEATLQLLVRLAGVMAEGWVTKTGWACMELTRSSRGAYAKPCLEIPKVLKHVPIDHDLPSAYALQGSAYARL